MGDKTLRGQFVRDVPGADTPRIDLGKQKDRLAAAFLIFRWSAFSVELVVDTNA